MEGNGNMSDRVVTLGLHIIAKDEAGRLSRCLQSAQSAADEIIVVDTGSSDNTPHIAESFGAVVIHHPWSDDFAAARNAGLRHATTDWIMVLDADEEILDGGDDLKRYLQSVAAPCCNVRFTHRTGDRPEDAVWSESVRLFRNGLGFRYAGAIHEQLVAGQTGEERRRDWPEAGGYPLSPLHLLHHGYHPSELARKGTADRNRRLLEKAADAAPHEPFTLYNLGVTYCQLGRLEEASASFAQAMAHVGLDAPYRPTLVRDYAQVQLALRRTQPMLRLLEQELVRYPDYCDLYWLSGQLWQAQGRLHEASRAYEAAVRSGAAEPSSRPYIRLAGAGTYRPATAWAGIARLRGQNSLAEELVVLALRAEPAYEPAWALWTSLLLETDSTGLLLPARIRAKLGEALPPAAARILLRAGAYDMAWELANRPEQCDNTGHADRADTDDEALLACLCLTRLQRHSEVLPRLQARADSGMKLTGELLEIGALCCWGCGCKRPDWLAQAGPPQLSRVYDELERLLFDADAQPAETTAAASPDPSPLLEHAAGLIDNALTMKLPALAETLAAKLALPEIALAKALYRRGYVMRATDRLLTLMQQGQLDAEGAFFIGETLFAKHHYTAAVEIFEQALHWQPDYTEARRGASECYIAIARQAAERKAAQSGDPNLLWKERQNAQAALLAMSCLPWRTGWTGEERRNLHE
ncbi:MAG: hypothetical protein K0Q59_240 [Paenibacillus sp.]|nr:hypothetical protein [Paenibacillus sp.]